MDATSPWSFDVEEEIAYLTTEEGGRTKPIFAGYRPGIYYDGHAWDAVHIYPDVESVMPGQTARAYLSFLSPECHVGRLFPGKEFEVREGGRIVAKGRVTKILELEASARQSGRDASDCWQETT
ncbi:MAG TPA: elongation factor Tu [Chloroflexia bacterium]|nr:elongation factor Tu [Chloroflexia bacterium]